MCVHLARLKGTSKQALCFSFSFVFCFLVQFRLLLRVVDETTTQTSTTMKHRWAALPPLFLLAVLVATVTGGCPPVDDPCMNEANHQKCQALVDEGCTNLIWLESCPLQFACGSYGNRRQRRGLRNGT